MIRETFRKLNEVQRGGRFRVIASVVVALFAVGTFVALWVAANDPATSQRIIEEARERSDQLTAGTPLSQGPIEAARSIIDSAILMLAQDTGGVFPVVFVIGSAMSVAILLINLGLGLSFLGLLLLGWGVAWPLLAFEPTTEIGQLLFAAVPLSLGFLAGVEVLRLLFSGPGPVNAIARNLINEAIRMKISVIFIVLLILFLSVVPGVLNENQPLRYRVQQWLQYGVGLSYAVLALLTLFLCVASVAFEQRERIIWQTMSKPTAPWQYLLGKWLGVMGLNALLLAVTAGGVFMFTEYLRYQPAEGEIAYQVPRNPRVDVTEDRRLLETQVLVARKGVSPEPDRPTEEKLEWIAQRRIEELREEDSSIENTAARRQEIKQELYDAWARDVEAAVDRRLRHMRSRDPRIADDESNRERLRRKVLEERELAYRSIPPGQYGAFLFLGLGEAKKSERDLTLKYKVQAGSNDPARLFNVTVFLNGQPWPRRDADGRPLRTPGLKQVHLDTFQTLSVPHEAIAEDGSLEVVFVNGAQGYPMNPLTITFPPDGLEVLYPVGSYGMNFTRIMFVLWIKLGFIAGVSLMTATFLSFPVACLVSLVVLFAAESAGFLHSALEFYNSKTEQGVDYFKLLVRIIAVPIAEAFKIYADLKPTTRLVDGRLVGWGTFGRALLVVGAWTGAMIMLGWLIFRKRELALYSGQ